jgi:Domain of unknown function (DUF4399)/Family of unknown function (DUF6130)
MVERRSRLIVVVFVSLALIASLFVMGLPLTTVSAASPPTLIILSPSNNSIVGNGSALLISFIVFNFNFTQPGQNGQTNVPNQGHMHVIVDGNYTELIVQVQTITLSLPDGAHLIRLQLVNNNHSPLTPDVSAWLGVKITHGPAGGTPSVVILSPKNGAGVGPNVDVSFAVFNFAMVQPYGQQDAPNEGHIHVLVDAAYNQLVASVETVHISGLAAGSHTITLQLVNNDHTPITPAVSAAITVTASSSSVTVSSAAFTTGELAAIGLGALNLILLIAVLAMMRGRKKETG